MQLFSSSIGRKIVMAITGQCMILFAIIHLLGNSTIFGWLTGGLNAYAHHLHSMPLPIIMGFRFGLLIFACLHIWYGIQVTIENRSGRSKAYAVKSTQKTTFASETMIWTGLLILAFIIYHLLHFTFQVIDPSTAALAHPDALGNPNVLGMVVAGFQNVGIALLYAVAMIVLFLHLSHGIQSSFQTMGWNNDRTQPCLTKGSTLLALIMFFGYVAVPFTILVHILK
ncbi:succinate dehydrogenase cytochrome b subunit [Geobacter sp. SVR]|uniref:succinate dehydrogenase cytochrome b subunit n=1 Tax=Geobacter sp. SVR TaxID=2495594 RepID=UPI00143EF96E|nr:succinate dehydrogenase cytochrome b subunit [Geobacter sp. SVR]BCS54311.1 fumarate reductase [Geobacter sp. SVR]GCF85830.1 fumarate reductase [Geobacter sp. SVR]